MRLKELHIRNIASIERADIDFEHGLNDVVTDQPASIFLISGDTGAGKSVILDGISMALYKKTPRIADVANATKNDYTDAEGEQIRVASIEQYTRLGISEKDDSYSEVVFEGNDGKEYHARLTLGMKLGNKDKETGLRPMKHRSPKWEIRVGSGDWTKDSVEQTIQEAVGLDFQQFGRMAMLAQGQFANFLTGDKKEREAILEQLTNTQHFTAYGEAIQSLWKKAKDAQAKVQVQYDTEKPHTLSDKEVESLTKEQHENLQQKEKLDKKIKAQEDRLKLIDQVLRNAKAQEEARRKKQELEAIAAGEEYQRDKTLFTDWDTTTAQRQTLADLQRAKREELTAKDGLQASHATFHKLSADIVDRQNQLKVLNDSIAQIQEWIDLHKQHDSLFAKAGETDLKIGQYLSNIKKASDTDNLLQKEKAKTEPLKKAEEDAVNKATEVDTQYKARKAEAEAANNRLTTMKMSVKDTIVALRRRLRKEHTETCPLCGSQIDHSHLSDDFSALLTPLEQEQQRTTEALNAAVEAKVKAEKTKTKAESDVKGNADAIIRLEKEHTTLLQECEHIKAEVDKLLSNYADEWQTDTEAIRKKLAEEAKEYTAHQKLLSDVTTKHDKARALIDALTKICDNIIRSWPDWKVAEQPQAYPCRDINTEWTTLMGKVTTFTSKLKECKQTIEISTESLAVYYQEAGKSEKDLLSLIAQEPQVAAARKFVSDTDSQLKSRNDAISDAQKQIDAALHALNISDCFELPDKQQLEEEKATTNTLRDEMLSKIAQIKNRLDTHQANIKKLRQIELKLEEAKQLFARWDKLNRIFGGTRFRTLVQTYILRPLLNNANIYLEQITDRYRLTCSEDNEQLSILVLDQYNKNQVRSVTVLSGGERFMISLALSLALSSLNRPDMNVNILFIDEGFGTLDERSLDSVMQTLEKLQEIAGQTNRRVGIISHREELEERIPVKIQVVKKGEGRSMIEVSVNDCQPLFCKTLRPDCSGSHIRRD